MQRPQGEQGLILDHSAHLDLRVSPAPREWQERLVWWENRWRMDTDH